MKKILFGILILSSIIILNGKNMLSLSNKNNKLSIQEEKNTETSIYKVSYNIDKIGEIKYSFEKISKIDDNNDLKIYSNGFSQSLDEAIKNAIKQDMTLENKNSELIVIY